VELLLNKGRGGFAGGMTNAKYVNLTKSSPATAQRDLAELVGAGVLKLTGAGRGARYEIQWDQAAAAAASCDDGSPSPRDAGKQPSMRIAIPGGE